jgi:hypothetical protein
LLPLFHLGRIARAIWTWVGHAPSKELHGRREMILCGEGGLKRTWEVMGKDMSYIEKEDRKCNIPMSFPTWWWFTKVCTGRGSDTDIDRGAAKPTRLRHAKFVCCGKIECAMENGGSVIVDRSEPSNTKVLLCLAVKGNKHPSAFFNHGITCKSGIIALGLVENHGIDIAAQR